MILLDILHLKNENNITAVITFRNSALKTFLELVVSTFKIKC